MIKKDGIIEKLFKKKKKEGNCCSFEIEEVTEEILNGEKENKCCDILKMKESC